MNIYIYERNGYKLYNSLKTIRVPYRDSELLGTIEVYKDGEVIPLDQASAIRFLESIPAGFHYTLREDREHPFESYCEYLRPSSKHPNVWEYKMVTPFTD